MSFCSRAARISKITFIGAFVLGMASTLYPCSTFMAPDSRAKVFGKNFVWNIGHGRVILNRKNIQKTAYLKNPTGLRPHQWMTKYPSLTFNQIAESFPMGGMNSEGVAVEILLARADHPTSSQKPVVDELQWIQLILDTASSTKEAREIAETVEVIPDGDLGVHYHVCDKSAECAIFEYINGKLAVSAEDTIGHNPLSADNSTYHCSVPESDLVKLDAEKLEDFDAPLAFADLVVPQKTSVMQKLEIFNSKEHASATSEALELYEILKTLSFSPQWQIVYELANGVIHFRTQVGGMTNVNSISLADFSRPSDGDCQKAVYRSPKANHKRRVLPQLSFDLATVNPQGIKVSELKAAGLTSYASPPASLVNHRLLSSDSFSKKPTNLVEQSRSFLSGSGLTDENIRDVFMYPQTHTRCILSP